MLAVRSFIRAAPRIAPRALRVQPITRSFVPSRAAALPRLNTFKTFSTSTRWREAAGDSDVELSAKLEHERQLEVESRDPETLPQELQDFLNDSSFQVEDKPNTETIVLTKKFGNETIRVEANISDMNTEQEFEDFDEDSALDDEADLDVAAGGKRNINQSGARGGKFDVAAEDSIAPSDRDADAADGEESTAFPLNLSITIEKPGAGATNILARSQDGDIEIEFIGYFPKAELIAPMTPEGAKEANELYRGPPFAHLDPDLQAMYETYVQERGIDTQLSWFLTKYVDYKEQREYVNWLANIKKFIDA